MKGATMAAIVGLAAISGALSLLCTPHYQPLIQSKLRSEALRQIRVVAGLRALSVDAVDGRDLVLTGEVEHDELTRRAEAIASRIPGVRRVVNRVDVAGPPEPRFDRPPTWSGDVSFQTGESLSPPWLDRWLEGERVVFAPGSDELTASARRTLDSLVLVLAAEPGARVEIAGHTDRRETGATNTRLDLRRARAVRLYLGRSLDVARFEVVGHGPSRPITDATRERRRNRRVEFRVIASEIG